MRDSGSVNGIRDLTPTREAGFAKIWERDAELGKKTIFGIAVTEVRHAGFSWKRDENAGSAPYQFLDPMRGGWSILATSTESDHFPVFVGHLAWLRHVSKFTLCVLWSMDLWHLKGRIKELLSNCTLLRELNPSRNKTEIDAEEPLTATELQTRLLTNTYWYPCVLSTWAGGSCLVVSYEPRIFFSMSMTKRPGHNLTGKESEDHNLKKWVRTLFPGGLPYKSGGDARRKICNLHPKARRRAFPSLLYGRRPPPGLYYL